VRQKATGSRSKVGTIVMIGMVILSFHLAPCRSHGQSPEIRFSWAVVYQEEGGRAKPIDYGANIVQLQSGDRFRFYLRSNDPCVTYLFLFDAQRDLYLLFPRNLDSPQNDSSPNVLYILPENDSWYFLDDDGGIETFYLVVSRQEQDRLESATRQYLISKSDGDGPDDLDIKYAVLDEIRRIIQENSHLSGVAEKPVAIAGELRGVDEEHQVRGIRVETDRAYVKTIRLAH
jgi:hypothetical protein